MATCLMSDLDLTEDEIHKIMAEKAKELFQLCDTENKGYLTRQDLGKLNEELDLSVEQLEAVYDSLDRDKNGCLTFDEFIEGFGNYLGVQYRSLRRSSVYEDGLSSSPIGGDQFHAMMDQFGAYGVFEDQEAIRSLWERLKAEEPHLVSSFERCLGKISSEMKKTHNEYQTVEAALKNRSSAHDEEVRHLYEEMENQIKLEKERFKQEEKARERQLRADMEQELAEKESQLQEVINRQRELEQRLSRMNMSEAEIKQENERLLKDKTELLQLLENSHDELEEQKSYLANVKKMTKEERRDRALQAVQVTTGIALERETLVRQLDLLRDMNKKLRDEQDIAESRKSTSGTPRPAQRRIQIDQARQNSSDQSRLPLTKQGSLLSNYFSPTLSQSSRSSGQSFHFDDLKSINDDEDDGIDYDDDVIDKEVSEIYNNNNNNTDVGDSAKLGGVRSGEGNNNVKITNMHTLPKPCENERLSHHRTDTSELGQDGACTPSADTSGNSGVRHDETQCSPSNRRRQEFVKQSKMAVTMNKDSNVECKSAGGQQVSPDAGVFVSVSLDSQDRQSPIGAHNTAGSGVLDNQAAGPSRVFKIVFVGDSGVGKSSFIHRFCENAFTGQFCATIGVDFQVKSIVVGDQVVALQLWDTAGQERYRSITKQYFRKSDGVIVMYDVTSESSFRNVRQWMVSIEEESEDETVIMLLGNKTDLTEDDSHRPVQYKDGVQLADSYGCLFFETSAKQGKNVQECMVALASLLEDNEDKQMEAAVKLQKTGKKAKCCK